MAVPAPIVPSLRSFQLLLRQPGHQKTCLRCLATSAAIEPSPIQLPSSRLPSSYPSPYRLTHESKFAPRNKIKTYPPPPSIRKAHPVPLADWNRQHIAMLDPTGSRTRLFERTNPDAPKPGDILLATFTAGDPFAGVVMSIRRRSVDTGVLLRNRLSMTGVEMWVKIYSPNVRSIEVVKRAEKRARRARLYYLRKPKHDRGSVESEVEQYLRRRRLIRSGALGVQNPNLSAKNPQSLKSGVKAS